MPMLPPTRYESIKREYDADIGAMPDGDYLDRFLLGSINRAIRQEDADLTCYLKNLCKRKRFAASDLGGVLASLTPSEDREHEALARYLDAHPTTQGRWFHVPNGSHRHKATAARLKRQGVKRGVPDIWIMHPKMILIIELKRLDGGTISKDQKEWCCKINETDALCLVARGCAEAIRFIHNVLGG